MINGILLVDKPVGWTSFDCVNYIRGIVAAKAGLKPKNIKVGHSGTLDPFASGLLVILVGKEYTKRAEEFSKQDKTYVVEMILGKVSNTLDSEGEITSFSDQVPSGEEVNSAVNSFMGQISQIPPSYSAKKINGQRAYVLARSGKEVQLQAVKVTVKSISAINYEYPTVKFSCAVTSGTYIRSLVADIGEKLGCGAYTAQLKRTTVGNYDLKAAISPKQLNVENIEQYLITA